MEYDESQDPDGGGLGTDWIDDWLEDFSEPDILDAGGIQAGGVR